MSSNNEIDVKLDYINYSILIPDNPSLQTNNNNYHNCNSEQQTRYRQNLQKLSIEACSLKNLYDNLIKKQYLDNKIVKNYTIRFNKIKRKEEESKAKKRKDQYLNLKKTQKTENFEKRKKMKEEYYENKKKGIIVKKSEVKKLKIKENNTFIKYKNNLKNDIMKKRRINEEEKRSTGKALYKQKEMNLKEIEERKIIQRENNLRNIEIIQGNQVYALKQIINDLESKIKIQNSINNSIRKKYSEAFKENINQYL